MSPTRLEGHSYTDTFNATYNLFRLPPEQRPPIPHFQQGGPIFTDHATSCSYGIPAKKGEVDRVSTDLRKSTQWGLLEDALTTSDGETELCLFNDQVGGLPSRAIVAVREHDSGKYNVTQTLKATANQCFRDDRTQVCFNSKSGNYETSTVAVQPVQLKAQEKVASAATPALSSPTATNVPVTAIQSLTPVIHSQLPETPARANNIAVSSESNTFDNLIASLSQGFTVVGGIISLSVLAAGIIANRKRLKRMIQNLAEPITKHIAQVHRGVTAGGSEYEVYPPEFVQVIRDGKGNPVKVIT